MVKNRSSQKRKPTSHGKAPVRRRAVVVKTAPVATTTSRKSVSKQIVQKGDMVQIHHRELLQATYVASQLYSVDSRISLNPGLSTYSGGSPMGTWLPSIATNYDRYRFKSLKFHFRTYAASTTPGMIIMSYDPNPDNANPSSLAETQNMHSIDGSVHENLTFDLTSKLPNDFKFVRTGQVASLPNYDIGFVNFSSIGSSGTPVGVIEVEYTVEFKQPQAGNSTTVVLPNIPVLPTQVIEATSFADNVVDTLYSIGTQKGNINLPTAIFRNGNQYGANLVSFTTVATPATQSGGKWVYPNGVTGNAPDTANCRFRTDDTANWPVGGTNRTFFKFVRPGRYIVRVEAPFDINIQATAAYQLFAYRPTPASGTPPSWTLPLVEAMGIDGYISTYKAQRIHSQQGVENSTTSPKTAADSTQAFEFEVAADPDDSYALLGGSVYQVQQAGDCSFTARTSTTVPARLIIKYLGTRLTSTGLYDV